METKPRILYLQKILLERTDEENPLSTTQLINILNDEYGISAHRTTVTKDIAALQEFGMDIVTIHSTQSKYFVASRKFELPELRATLEYDFSQEKDFSYKGLSMDEIIHHLAVFVSRLWQIHIFGEGNTRTTAVFFIKYLRTLGFSATNDIFAENAWYFRNALVRANYTNLQKGIHETTEYLEAFLRNLLLNEKNELHNRKLHINGLLNEEKVDIGDTKVDIENEKVDIQDPKVDIESVLSEKGSDFSVKTTVHIHRLFERFGFDEVFGRSAVMEILELKSSGASKLLSNLVQADIIEPVSDHGKGKYKFKK